MQPAHDHTAGRNAEVTKASILPRRLAKTIAIAELAAIATNASNEEFEAGRVTEREPFAGRVEMSVGVGDLRLVRGCNIAPNASKEEKEATRQELIDELFADLIRLAADRIAKRKLDEPWKPMSLGQRVIGFFEMQFVAFAVLLGWTPKGKRGAK